MNRNSDLYTRMSEVLKAIFPSVSRAYQKYPIPTGLARMASAFMGCVVNIGSAETQNHIAMSRSQCLVSAVFVHLVITHRVASYCGSWKWSSNSLLGIYCFSLTLSFIIQMNLYLANVIPLWHLLNKM